MSRTRRPVLCALVVLAVALAGCGGDDADDAAPEGTGGVTTAPAGDGEPAAEVPAECTVETPVSVPVEGGEHLPGIDGPTFEAESALAVRQPIVPDPDQSLGFEEAQERAAETDLLAYTVYLADFPLEEDDVTGFTLSPPADGTYVSLTVVPPTETPLATGDVVTGGSPEFEAATTFGTVGTQYETGTSDDAPRLAIDEAENPGEVEILHLDDEVICLAWAQGGSLFGGDEEGTWSVDTVVAAPVGPRLPVALG